MLLYNKLFARLKAEGKSERWLRATGISPSLLSGLKKGTMGLGPKTIDHICEVLNCQPGDLMEFVPTSDGKSLKDTEQEE